MLLLVLLKEQYDWFVVGVPLDKCGNMIYRFLLCVHCYLVRTLFKRPLSFVVHLVQGLVLNYRVDRNLEDCLQKESVLFGIGGREHVVFLCKLGSDKACHYVLLVDNREVDCVIVYHRVKFIEDRNFVLRQCIRQVSDMNALDIKFRTVVLQIVRELLPVQLVGSNYNNILTSSFVQLC